MKKSKRVLSTGLWNIKSDQNIFSRLLFSRVLRLKTSPKRVKASEHPCHLEIGKRNRGIFSVSFLISTSVHFFITIITFILLLLSTDKVCTFHEL